MRRLLVFLLLTALSGCTGFDEYFYEEGSMVGPPSVAPPASCGCNSPGATAAAAVSSVPAISQSPAGQTREPDLNSSRR
jgi:hypothetical protein